MKQELVQDLQIGNNLKRLRKISKLTKKELCAELQHRGCDISKNTYEKYESGESNIRIDVIIALKKIYNCSYDDFFSEFPLDC